MKPVRTVGSLYVSDENIKIRIVSCVRGKMATYVGCPFSSQTTNLAQVYSLIEAHQTQSVMGYKLMAKTQSTSTKVHTEPTRLGACSAKERSGA